MADMSKISRRTALGLIGGGGILTVGETLGFTALSGTRKVNLSTSSDPDGLVGLLISDQVQKNQREQLVEISNDITKDLGVTIELSGCTQTTLYGPDGNSGCAVTFNLSASGTVGDTKAVNIESGQADGTIIQFQITATSSTGSFKATRSTEVVTGNTAGAVEITRVKKFRPHRNDNNWTIEEVEAVSNNTNYELERVEYEVTSNAGSGDVVGTFEESASGNEYVRNGSNNDPAIVITPDNSHQIQKNNEYQLTITVYDSDGNFSSTTETHKA